MRYVGKSLLFERIKGQNLASGKNSRVSCVSLVAVTLAGRSRRRDEEEEYRWELCLALSGCFLASRDWFLFLFGLVLIDKDHVIVIPSSKEIHVTRKKNSGTRH